MNTALGIVTLLNALVPGIAQIIILVKRNDGTISVMPLLDEADAKFSENLKQIADWMKAHPV